eukprot:TRINITY_DN231_c0_g1_i1.p2 TRINITY_DN231_c0_g1~~TRINITY_DN231_c0_g1_i1.p2  ORF type:complete len:377 (+),score=86.95 TRINITY_DN231_c0_g1_i1:123-1253(+)
MARHSTSSTPTRVCWCVAVYMLACLLAVAFSEHVAARSSTADSCTDSCNGYPLYAALYPPAHAAAEEGGPVPWEVDPFLARCSGCGVGNVTMSLATIGPFSNASSGTFAAILYHHTATEWIAYAAFVQPDYGAPSHDHPHIRPVTPLPDTGYFGTISRLFLRTPQEMLGLRVGNPTVVFSFSAENGVQDLCRALNPLPPSGEFDAAYDVFADRVLTFTPTDERGYVTVHNMSLDGSDQVEASDYAIGGTFLGAFIHPTRHTAVVISGELDSVNTVLFATFHEVTPSGRTVLFRARVPSGFPLRAPFYNSYGPAFAPSAQLNSVVWGFFTTGSPNQKPAMFETHLESGSTRWLFTEAIEPNTDLYFFFVSPQPEYIQ